MAVDAGSIKSNTHKVGWFRGMKAPRSLLQYKLYQGITDFGALEQFNILQGGRQFIKILQYPEFLRILGEKNSDYKSLIDNALHIIEYEFKNIDGIDDITTGTAEITDGVNSIQVINSAREQSATNLSMRYLEKTGSPLTKFTELYLQGIYDTRSTFKHYHGLIEDGTLEDGLENEVFTLLYWMTDPTGLRVEQAIMFLDAQLNNSDRSIYNSTKGEHDPKEITITFNAFSARSPEINDLASEMTLSMSILRNAVDMEYTYTQNHVSAF